MKRLILIMVLGVFVLGSTVVAQQKPFVFGVRFAPNIGWLNPEEKGYKNDGVHIGFSWGVITEFFLMENYAVVTGFDVVYLYPSMKYPTTLTVDNFTWDADLERDYRLRYVEIPLALKMRTNSFGKFRFYGMVGIGTGVLLSARADDRYLYGNTEYTQDDVDIYDRIVLFRESLILGLGLEYNISKSTVLHVAPRFDNGFTNILKGDDKAKANFVELSIGIVF